MDEIGPVDYAVIAFPGNQFKGEIVPALGDLVEAGTIRIIDAAFVSKERTGKCSRSSRGARSGRAGGARGWTSRCRGSSTTRSSWPLARSSSRTPRRLSWSGRTLGS